MQDSVDSSGHLSEALQTLQDQLAEKREELVAVQAVHHKELAAVQDRWQMDPCFYPPIEAHGGVWVLFFSLARQ